MNDFWGWAVRAYAGKGVADLCLSLQDDDDQNVPLLLWAAWLATEGRAADSVAADAANLVRQWSEAAILPLRTVRRRLKTEVADGDEAWRLPLREKIKAAELEAERGLMAQLAALRTPDVPVKNDTNHTINAQVAQNLRVVARAWHEKVPGEALMRLSQALSDGQFLRYDGSR